MLKIKLQPTGKKNQKYYRIVVASDRSKLTGKYIALLGHYNPKDPKNKIVLNKKNYQTWINNGAQPTDTVRKLVIKNQ